jgi:hypothetical protein
MPTWASVLIALTSGLGSGTFAAWLTTRNDRRVLHRSARVDLLFGPGRDASQAANAVMNALANVVASLTPPSFDADAAERAHLDAAEALRGFHVAASYAIQQGKPPVVTA